MALPDQFDLTGEDSIYSGDTWVGIDYQFGRFVADGVLVASSAVVTSVAAGFAVGDAGAVVVAYTLEGEDLVEVDWIPDGATILSVSGNTATLSAPATVAGTGVVLAVGAMDMTGYSYLAQIRRTERVETILATVPFTPKGSGPRGGYHLGPLTPVQTRAVCEGLRDEPGVWDLEETAPDASVDTFVAGTVTGVPDVSRAS